jgi:hypothetical protein
MRNAIYLKMLSANLPNLGLKLPNLRSGRDCGVADAADKKRPFTTGTIT